MLQPPSHLDYRGSLDFPGLFFLFSRNSGASCGTLGPPDFIMGLKDPLCYGLVSGSHDSALDASFPIF